MPRLSHRVGSPAYTEGPARYVPDAMSCVLSRPVDQVSGARGDRIHLRLHAPTVHAGDNGHPTRIHRGLSSWTVDTVNPARCAGRTDYSVNSRCCAGRTDYSNNTACCTRRTDNPDNTVSRTRCAYNPVNIPCCTRCTDNSRVERNAVQLARSVCNLPRFSSLQQE